MAWGTLLTPPAAPHGTGAVPVMWGLEGDGEMGHQQRRGLGPEILRGSSPLRPGLGDSW